ncbi:MAG: epoxyqueuosine reductase QueH [Patescibacteria group bacterium]
MNQPLKKILVHTCCALCSSHVLKQLEHAGFKVVIFFYNPQISDPEEHQKRLDDVRRICQDKDYEWIAPDLKVSDFSNLVEPYKNKQNIKYISDKDRYQRRRCNICNTLLMQKTVEQAKKARIKFFTTTLLCSPYKDHDLIIEVCNERALDYNVNFYYQDFRKGYWMGRNYGRSHDAHIPAFCGCEESREERRLE